MSEQNKKRCLVLLPKGPYFARLFNEILALTLIEGGLIPSRIQAVSQSPMPALHLLQQIEQADVLLADLSEDNTEIWFAVGVAIALGKPLCLISSRAAHSSQFIVEQLPIIIYPATAFPSDYLELQQSIAKHLTEYAPQAKESVRPTRQKMERSITTSAYAPVEALAAASQVEPHAQSSHDNDLVSYEVLALTILDLKAADSGLSPRDLGLEMRDNDSAHLTSHAMNALKRRGFIERKPVYLTEGPNYFVSDNLFITPLGEQWLIRNGKRTTIRHANASGINIVQSI
jgi:hypothetical protein